MNSLLEWLRAKAPGAETATEEELRIEHSRFGVSSLWFPAEGRTVPRELRGLKLYDDLDGADLFSSTFKIASLNESKPRQGVKITPSLVRLSEMAKEDSVEFPGSSVPFMLQAGIGYYAVAPDGTIYEWDTETLELSREYDDIFEVLDEWLEAMTVGEVE